MIAPSIRPRRSAVFGRSRPRPVRRGWRQVARTVAHSSAVRPRAWPRRGGASAASVRRNPSSARRVSGPIGTAVRASRAARLTVATCGDHHRGGRGRAAGLVKVPQVGGEARVVERSSLEPGVELAAGHGVGAAGVGRRRALEEPDRGLDAGVSRARAALLMRTFGAELAGYSRVPPADRSPCGSCGRFTEHAGRSSASRSSHARVHTTRNRMVVEGPRG